MIFSYETTVRPDWIDYNGHMQDAYYGLIFSYAVDALQDAVGFDDAYRTRTDHTIYLVEDHKFFLREVGEGEVVRVETRVLGCDEKRFHLHLTMAQGGEAVAVCEAMELHVRRHPTPRAAPMPREILERLRAATLSADEVAALTHRARPIGPVTGSGAG